MGARKGEKYYKAKAVVIRDLNGIRIVFYDRETIYVRDEQGNWVIFHRWFAPKGSYNNSWRAFRYKLFYEKKISSAHCYRLAFQHDIVAQRALHEPNLSKFKVEVRY